MADTPDKTEPAEPTAVRGADDASPLDPAALAALQARAAEADALADKLKRVEAEFVNETKRIRRQAEQDRKYAIESVIVDLLPVVDALQGARESLGESAAADAMRAGLALVQKQLDGIFQRYGISAIEALGQPFDPARHQAMLMVVRDDCEPQTVCEVLRVGYELNGRVVRPAEVIVSKAAPGAQPAEQPSAARDDS